MINLMWALVYNLAGIALAALGLFQPVAAAGLMAGSSLLVILNSLRLERIADEATRSAAAAFAAAAPWVPRESSDAPGRKLALTPSSLEKSAQNA
jgi:Cu2+-exporting ATPase